MYILEIASNELIEAEIVSTEQINLPTIKEGWNFDWRKIARKPGSEVYCFICQGNEKRVEGLIQLTTVNGMLIMDLLEIAPHNIGSNQKRYDYVAGCLIAFACRKSFQIKGNYQGILTFVSKTKLIAWYSQKYHAIRIFGQRMYIDDEGGEKLIEEYLNRKK